MHEFDNLYMPILARPSSPKPAFAVTQVCTENARYRSSDRRLTPGACRLKFRLHERENYDHFRRSVRKLAKREHCWIIVVDQTFWNLDQVCVKYTRLNVHSIPRSNANRDSIYVNVPKLRQIAPSKVPPRSLWLFYSDSGSYFGAHRESLGHAVMRWRKRRHQSTDPQRSRKADDSISKISGRVTLEPPIFRVLRKIFALVASIVLVVGTTIGIWTGNSQGLFYFIWLAIPFSVLAHIVWHLYCYFRYEVRKSGWTGGTTGCIRDDTILRMGTGDSWDDL